MGGGADMYVFLFFFILRSTAGVRHGEFVVARLQGDHLCDGQAGVLSGRVCVSDMSFDESVKLIT